MRKERTLRESMQTELKQQPNSEKINRRRNERTTRINKLLRRKHSSHKRNQDNKRNEQTFYSSSTNQRDKERIYNRYQIAYFNNSTRRKICQVHRNSENNKLIPRRKQKRRKISGETSGKH